MGSSAVMAVLLGVRPLLFSEHEEAVGNKLQGSHRFAARPSPLPGPVAAPWPKEEEQLRMNRPTGAGAIGPARGGGQAHQRVWPVMGWMMMNGGEGILLAWNWAPS